MKYDVITIGGIVRDFTFYIQEGEISNDNFIFPLDSKILVKQAYFTNGGGANNVAVGLARFGLKVALVGRIGHDFSGQAILKNLRKNKIETKFIQTDKKLHTGVSVIIQQEKRGKILFTHRGANEKLKFETRDLKFKTKWIYLASLTGEWQKILERVFSMQEGDVRISPRPVRVGPRIVWNPGTAQLVAGRKKLTKFLKQTSVLILNRHEAAQLVNSKFEIRNPKQIQNLKSQISKLLLKIYKLGPKIVAITAGNQGAYIYDGQRFYYQSAKNKRPKDTTGAGDAFSSGFLAGLVLFDDIKKALRLGILNSGAVIQKVGAQEGLLDKKNLRNL